MVSLLCEHSELFSETWQTEGMMQNGQVFALPMQARHTTDSEFSLSPILRTPAASEAERGHQPESKSRARGGQVTLSGQMMEHEPSKTNWGKFAPAINRWSQALGRPAPLPTKPDGKEGAHRLSSAFTEWMMGVPAGWITDVGLTRNEELKACGNGVVPQQAELALRVLLEGITLPRGGGASESTNSNSQ